MPTVDIPDRVCPHCGGTKWYYEEKRDIYSCKQLKREKYTEWRHKNIEKFREHRRNYYHTKVDKKKHYENTRKRVLSNPEREKAYKLKYSRSEKGKQKKKEYALSHPEETRLGKRKAREIAVCNLKDSYMRSLLSRNCEDITYSDSTPELIELKRKQLQLTRQIKAHGKAN